MPALLRSAVLEAPHLFAENIHLGLIPCLDSVIRGGGSLPRQREGHALLFQRPIAGLQKRQRSAQAQIGRPLVDQFLQFHRCHPICQGIRHQTRKRLRALAAHQSGQDRQETSLSVQAALLNHLVKGKVIEQPAKFRVLLLQTKGVTRHSLPKLLDIN